MTQAIQFLLAALKDAPNSICNYQLAAIEAVREILKKCRTVGSLPPVSTKEGPPPKLIVPVPIPSPISYPAPTYKGNQGRYRVTTSKFVSPQ